MTKPLTINQHDRLLLQNSDLLRGLNPGLVSRILTQISIISAEAREDLYRQGDIADCFYVVLSGYIRLFRCNGGEREADIGIFGPGETFGECMMFRACEQAFGARAAGPAVLACFPLDRIRTIVHEEPEFADAVMSLMARHLIDARENVADDRLHTGPQRVANYLHKLALTHGAGKPLAFRLPFQKSLLARKLGLAPEALSRALASMKKSGITIRGRLIEVSDVDALGHH